MDDVLRHPSHPHPLKLHDLSKDWIFVECPQCNNEVEGLSYCCQDCDFFLHKSCAELRQRPHPQIDHPLHSQHPVTLQVLTNEHFPCRVCHETCDSFAYGCRCCFFYMDVSCAMATLPEGLTEKKHEEGKVTLSHFAHEHRLTSCDVTKGSKIHCRQCKVPISGAMFCCPECSFFLHKGCAELQPKIQHRLHPQHPLALVQHSGFNCRSCREYCEGSALRCETCEFCIDIECALHTLAYLEKGASPNIQPSVHTHLVDLCHIKEVDSTCTACGQSLQGPAYRCPSRDCSIVLHKSCAELPSVLTGHPFHPDHPITLLSEPSNDFFTCGACHTKFIGLAFCCAQCEFRLDLACASEKMTIKHPGHRHSLSYFKKASTLRCNACCESGDAGLYRCVECNFNLHRRCLALPHTANNPLFNGPLTLSGLTHRELSGHCGLCTGKFDPHQRPCYRSPEITYYQFHIECALFQERPEAAKATESSGGQSSVEDERQGKLTMQEVHQRWKAIKEECAASTIKSSGIESKLQELEL